MTPDPRAVEIAARALEDVQPPESDPTPPDEAFFADARRVLAALEAAGWSLLPPGGQTRDPREIVARTQWALDHEDATPDDWDEYADQETRELYLRDADSVLAALRDAGLLAEPGTNWHVVVKTVPGRDPELMAEIVNGADELRAWLADLRNDPDRDRLAAFTGYRLTPVTEEAR